MQIRSTREVAALFKCTPGNLIRAIYENRLDPPQRGPGGCYLWQRDDIIRASWQLRGRNAADIMERDSNV